MGIKDKHGGFERIALKTAAIQSAGQVAEVQGFESNYGTGMGGVESFLGDSTQQARKKFASVHGAARAIKGWSNNALAENAEFSEQSSIESAQAQIREGGGNAIVAAHKMARKAAADMRGLVKTQAEMDARPGGYEEITAFTQQQSALKASEMVDAMIKPDSKGNRLAAFVKVKDKNGVEHETNTLQFTKIGREAVAQDAHKSAGEQVSRATMQSDPDAMRGTAVATIAQGHGAAEQREIAKDLYDKKMITVPHDANGRPNFALVVSDSGEINPDAVGATSGREFARGVGTSAGEKMTGLQGVIIGGREMKLAKGIVSSSKITSSKTEDGEEYSDITGFGMKHDVSGHISKAAEATGNELNDQQQSIIGEVGGLIAGGIKRTARGVKSGLWNLRDRLDGLSSNSKESSNSAVDSGSQQKTTIDDGSPHQSSNHNTPPSGDKSSTGSSQSTSQNNSTGGTNSQMSAAQMKKES